MHRWRLAKSGKTFERRSRRKERLTKKKKLRVHFDNKFWKDNVYLYALHFAALHSDFTEQNLVDLFLKRGMERDTLIEAAYFSGNRKVIEYAPIKDYFEWQSALYGACQGNQVELVEEIIRNCKGRQLSWDTGLHCACAGAAKDTIRLMIEKGATDFNWALNAACKELQIDFSNDQLCIFCWKGERGDEEIVDFLLSKGADDYESGLEGACRGDKKKRRNSKNL